MTCRRLAAAALWFCTVVAVAAPAAAAPGFDHGAFDRLLRKHVRSADGGKSTRVDYAGFARDRDTLRGYLQRAGQVSRRTFGSWPKHAQLAFLINLYNAATIDFVLSEYPDLDSIKDLGGLFSSPWKKDRVVLFGKKVSLDDVEHGWIRKRGNYRDPRIHFAVNCASIGCPALRAEAYRADALDRQLDEQAELFLSDRTRNRLAGDTLRVSKIFDWYDEDFERGWRGVKSVRQFLADQGAALGLDAAQIAALREGRIDIEYADYSWKLNDTRRR